LPERTSLPLLRLKPSRSVVCKALHGSLGSPREPARANFFDARSPVRFAVRSSAIKLSSSSFSYAPPLQSSFAARPRPISACAATELDLPRFRPSSRLHPTASTHREASHRLTSFRPQAFSASRRLPPRSGLQAYFIPLPRPGLACSGSSPLAQPSSLIDPSCAPLPLCAPRSPTEIGCRVERPRLRGFVPREIAFARLSYSPRRASLPSSGFVSSRSSFFPRCAPVYLVPSTLEVTVNRLRFRARRSRSSSAFPPREARLVCLQAADPLEFSSLPFESPKTLD